MSRDRTTSGAPGATGDAEPSLGAEVRRGIRRAPLWFAGLVVAAVGAVIIQGLTGWFGGLADDVGGEPAPLAVNADPPQVGGRLYFAQSPADLEPVPTLVQGGLARAAWADARGGADAGSTTVKVTITARSEAVVLQEVRIRVIDRSPARPGTVVDATGAGGTPTLYFTTDLDEALPVATFVRGENAGVDDRSTGVPWTVATGEPVIFFIIASTAGCDCRWVAELDWGVGERDGTTVVDDGGEPFRTVGEVGSDLYRADDQGRLDPT